MSSLHTISWNAQLRYWMLLRTQVKLLTPSIFPGIWSNLGTLESSNITLEAQLKTPQSPIQLYLASEFRTRVKFRGAQYLIQHLSISNLILSCEISFLLNFQIYSNFTTPRLCNFSTPISTSTSLSLTSNTTLSSNLSFSQHNILQHHTTQHNTTQHNTAYSIKMWTNPRVPSPKMWSPTNPPPQSSHRSSQSQANIQAQFQPLSPLSPTSPVGTFSAPTQKLKNQGKRVAQIVKLKPEFVDKYKECHAKVWPEVLKQIKDCCIEDCTLTWHAASLFRGSGEKCGALRCGAGCGMPWMWWLTREI